MRFGQLERPEATDLEPGQLPYDGRFVFARLRYTQGVSPDELGGGRMFGRRGGRGSRARLVARLPARRAQLHEDPRGDHDARSRTRARPAAPSSTSARRSSSSIPSPTWPRPGFWTQTDEEAANLRAYLLKGGFIIFDDFRGNDWTNFEAQMKRVLPDVRMVELELSHPIFHSFFDIATLEFQQYYDRGTPLFIGAYLDNDPNKRLLFIANYNNDVGEYWEFSDTGWTPIDLSNEAYKLGVNYIIYGLTH